MSRMTPPAGSPARYYVVPWPAASSRKTSSTGRRWGSADDDRTEGAGEAGNQARSSAGGRSAARRQPPGSVWTWALGRGEGITELLRAATLFLGGRRQGPFDHQLPGGLGELRGRRGAQQPAGVDDHHVVADAFEFAEQVRRHQDRDAEGRPIRRTSASMSSRPTGSRPFVGLSSSTSFGSCTSAWASFTRCRMPVEYPPIGR